MNFEFIKCIKLVADCLLLFLQGKMDAAANMIEKAIIANPTYAEAYNNLGLFAHSPFLYLFILFKFCLAIVIFTMT